MRTLTEIRNDLVAKTKEIAPLAQRSVNGVDEGLNADKLKQFRPPYGGIEQLKTEGADA